MGRRLPRTRGRLSLDGLDGALSIRRDSWGIPHVDAATPHDAWFALGFCQAQDRAFQLETLLRVGRGTLAEMVGRGGLIADRMSRRIGFARTAERQLPILAPEVRATIGAFVDGINARRPHEFVLLRTRPTRWEPADVLAFAGLQAFSLSSNWDAELARLRASDERARYVENTVKTITGHIADIAPGQRPRPGNRAVSRSGRGWRA